MSCTHCGGKHYAKGYCQKHYRRLRKGIPLDYKKPIKTCTSCGKQEHEAKGLCKKCYNLQHWNKYYAKPKRDKPTHCVSCGKEEIKAKSMCQSCYEKDRRRKLKQKDESGEITSSWTADDLEYICKFSEMDDTSSLAIGVDKSESSVSAMLKHLRRTGKFDYYKQSYERKMEA